MARVDSGAPGSATESVAGWAFAILLVSLLSLLERMPAARFRGPWGYVPVVANGAIRGLAAVACDGGCVSARRSGRAWS